MKDAIFFALNALLSAVVGIAVGGAVWLLDGGELYSALLKGAGLGALIGTLAKASVRLLFRYTLANPRRGYALTAAVVALLSWSCSYRADWKTMVLLLAIAEPLALLTMYVNMRYFYKWNDKLKQKQQRLV